MVCFMGYLSEAGDEHSTAHQFQDSFMLLKRAKCLLTSAFPDTRRALFPNRLQIQHNNYGKQFFESKSINIQTSCLFSRCLSNNTHLLSDAAKHESGYGQAEQADHTTEAKCFEMNENNGSVMSRWHDMNPGPGALPGNLGCSDSWEPQRSTVSLR